MAVLQFVFAVCALILLSGRANAQIVCEPGWSDEFAAPESAPDPWAMVEFDFGDGAGPVLVAGGSGLAVWNGMTWEPKGNFSGGLVMALAVFDHGTAPTLVAGGTFTFIDGVSKPRLVKWDASAKSWQTFGGTTNAGVHALAVWDDGTGGGPALYAGGEFTTMASQPADRLARWDGKSWAEVGDGVQGGPVWSLLVHDDGAGAGPALFIGGEFTTVGTLAANRIAKWSGPSIGWSQLGSGLTLMPLSNPVGAYSMCSFDDGTGAGEELFVGGRFNNAGGQTAICLAKWNGATQTWSSVGGGTNNTVNALLGWNGALYVGGQFDTVGGRLSRRIAKWTPPTPDIPDGMWSPLGLGVTGQGAHWVRSLHIHQPQRGLLANDQVLLVGGPFQVVYSSGVVGTSLSMGVWDGSQWRVQGHGLNGNALALARCDGSGIIYAGGDFSQASGLPAQRVVQWSGTGWSTVGNATFNGSPSGIHALLAEPADDGCNLYVGGTFTGINGNGSPGVAMFDGATWSALGSGLGGGTVHDLLLFNDSLYACGSFTNLGVGVKVAQWDGAVWNALGTMAGTVAYDLEIFDDGQGGGPALHVCGSNFFRRWNGKSWDSLGTFNETVRTLAVFDDGSGSGPALYAGGSFTMVDGTPAAQLVKWNGASFEQVGSGFDGPAFPNPFITSLSLWTDPPLVEVRSALLVGGEFTSAGGVPANYLALWDGKAWHALGSGVEDRVWALQPANHAEGHSLFVGGWFNEAGGLPADGIARWDCLSPIDVLGDITGNGFVDVDDLLAVINQWGECNGTCPPSCPADIAPLGGDCTVGVDDLLVVINNWS